MRRGTSLMSLVTTVALAGGVVTGGLLSFEESAIRSRAVRARANMAELARGLEAYAIDWGVFPYDGYNYIGASSRPDRYEYWYPPLDLTTPVCYVDQSAFFDPFRLGGYDTAHWQYRHLRYTGTDATWGDLCDDIQTGTGFSSYYDDVMTEWGRWRIICVGPDGTYGPIIPAWPGISGYPAGSQPYDPTNGANSLGDLIRSQLSEVGYLNIPQP